MIPRKPARQMIDSIVFFLCLGIGMVYLGFELGAYSERIRKEAACVAIPPVKSFYDMSKKQRDRWIKYCLSKGEV